MGTFSYTLKCKLQPLNCLTLIGTEGAAYVLHGAHRRGGRVLASTMGKAGLPTAHVIYPLPAEVEALVKALRDRADLASGARAVFAGLLAVMDEIEVRR